MGKLDLFNSCIKKIGFKLGKYNVGTDASLRRISIYKNYKVSLLLDVGANTGIYGKEMRSVGFEGKIISYEPLSDAFEKLARVANELGNWEVNNFALGDENVIKEINISNNSHSSSILDILDTHTNAEVSASYVGKQKIELKTLDSIANNIVLNNYKEVFLKIDTQGFELNVLKGAEHSLNFINTIQLEMSLVPLYSGQALYDELFQFLWQRGYTLIDIEPGFVDAKQGKLLQFDGIFRKL